MTLKKWIIIMLAVMLLCACAFMAMNVIVDPFGVFGDSFLDWYSYDMTMNPRTSKIAYLDREHENYNSYIIGCSKTSSFSAETLEKYYPGSSFYNMLMYGGDMYDIEKTALYIIENYSPERIIINLGLEETVSYNTGSDDLKTCLHAKVDGSSLLTFYLRHLFLHPQYSWDKLSALREDTYLPTTADVFDVETGAYDKSLRDVEAIGSLEAYRLKYPAFAVSYGKYSSMPYTETVARAVGNIKSECERRGIEFALILSPEYCTELRSYEREDLENYWRALAAVTDFWDFSGFTSVSYDSRYFYDAYHFRNAVGDMALARMFGDESVYVPDDLGYHVSAENVEERLLTAFYDSGEAAQDNSASVPILLYHGIGYEKGNSLIVTPETFESQMSALHDAGYTAVFFDELLAYVEKGEALPEKAVVISFDDGYENNYEYAMPILEKYGLCATVHVIGVSLGKDTYKDTGVAIYPHFDADQAEEMLSSGVFDLQSHSYDMHQSETLDADARVGVLQKSGEGESEYISALRADVRKSIAQLRGLGSDAFVFAYPQGYYTSLSEAVLREEGIKISLSVNDGVAEIIKGLPQSLLALERLNVTEADSPERLLQRIGGQ